MIEARTDAENTAKTTKVITPTTITTSMIIADLEGGTDRKGIQDKYGLAAWELTEMFKHPVLKGKKVHKKKRLSFTFLDDTTVDTDSDQIDLETSITEVESEYTTDQKDAMHQEVEDRIQMENDDTSMEYSNGFDV